MEGARAGRRMMRTPARPTAVASQRRRPTRSPRKKIDNAVTNSGETKPVAEASAIGRKRRPEMRTATTPATRRRASPADRGGETAARKRQAGQHRGAHDQREHQETKPGDLDRRQRRRQVFRGNIRSPQKHRRGEDQCDAAERPVSACSSGRRGWLVVAQAMRLCPAWRLQQKAGSRVNSGAEVIESGEAAKDDICVSRARSENRTPICTPGQPAAEPWCRRPLQHRQAPRFRPARKCRLQ